jgi:alpha-tubulin suppressor-like RCC1 family protein
LGLKQDGSVVGWGRNDYGQANTPQGNDFVVIAAGGYHSLALRQDGSVVGWGRNNYGQATPPVQSGFVAIAAGELQSPAILESCEYALAGDVSDDCKVDSQDLKILSEQWLDPNGIADLDKVNGVNLIDFALVAKNWLIDCDAEPGNPACVSK